LSTGKRNLHASLLSAIRVSVQHRVCNLMKLCHTVGSQQHSRTLSNRLLWHVSYAFAC